MPQLNILTGDGQESIYVLEKDLLSIGRSMDSDIVLSDHTISRKHAHIKKTTEGYVIIDQGSHNGTAVNGRPIQDADLNDGDILLIADVEFTFALQNTSNRRDTVTMAIDDGSGPAGDGAAPYQLVREVRRVHEMLTHRGVRCSIRPMVSVPSSRGRRTPRSAGPPPGGAPYAYPGVPRPGRWRPRGRPWCARRTARSGRSRTAAGT